MINILYTLGPTEATRTVLLFSHYLKFSRRVWLQTSKETLWLIVCITILLEESKYIVYLLKIVTCYCPIGAGYNVDKHLDLCCTSNIYYPQLLCTSLDCHSPSTAPQLLAVPQLISQLMDSACPLCSAMFLATAKMAGQCHESVSWKKH